MSLWQKLSTILTLHCEEASQLTSEGMERSLTRTERLALFCHTVICFSCRQFAKQLRFMKHAFHRSHQHELESLEHGPELDPAFKERLKQLGS